MLYISAVQTGSTESDVRKMAALARKYNCIACFAMPSYTALLAELLKDCQQVGVGGVAGFPSGATSTPAVVRQRIREISPMGHVQRPEDLYGAVVFLASAASNYVTGHDLLVDGGHTLNAWLAPLSREIPPRVSPDQESVQMKTDLDKMGVQYDSDGVNPDLHPEIADLFKQAFDL